MDLSDRRADYTKDGLERDELDACPIRQFERWFREAEACELLEPNAMCLATVGADLQPSTRIVLLKEVSEHGFVFYSNYESRKGTELSANPKVAANFLWLPLQRQVNITGVVERLSEAESFEYFASRPLASRLGAWASPQSQEIESRADLESRLGSLQAEYADGDVPLPPNWGGYRVVPQTVEFWQGGSGRLHDRFRYRLNASAVWDLARLAP